MIMKNVVDVQLPNIREMDKNELKEVEGGSILGLLAAFAIGYAIAYWLF
jgi:lactobin A/cerein 7B family class IIb bacteriocin